MDFPRFFYFSALRRRLALCGYLIGIALLLMGLLWPARPPIRRELLLLQDLSRSITASGARVDRARLTSLLESADSVRWIAFAGNVEVRETPGEAKPYLEPWQSDIAAAVRLASGLPAQGLYRRRAVLLSDARQTRGDAEEVARAAAARMLLEAIPVGSRPRPDVRALRLEASPLTRPAEAFDVYLYADSAVAEPAEAILETGEGVPLARKQLDLMPAGGRFRFSVRLQRSGLHRVQARLAARDDRVPENNIAAAAVLVTGGERVLWLGESPPRFLDNSTITMLTPAELQSHHLRGVSCIVLDDVAADALPPRSIGWFERAVRSGMGMLVLGGEASLGFGGYDEAQPGHRAPLGELLPVEILPRERLALVLALDVSGSMKDEVPGAPAGTTKLWQAGEAVLAACWRLQPDDRVSVVAFAREARTLLPLTVVDETTAWGGLRERLQTLGAHGGTSVFAGLARALDLLREGGADAQRRHVILLTDGDTAEEGETLDKALAAALENLRQTRAGLSAIAVGEPNAALLQALAGDNYVRAQGDLLRLPAILRREVEKQRRLLRREIRVAGTGAHPAVSSLRAHALPPLARQVAVGPLRDNLPGATTLLRDEENNVLAAAGRVGLGRVAVLTGAPWREWNWPAERAADLTRPLLRWCLEGNPRGTVRARPGARSLHVSFVPAADADDTPPALRARVGEREIPLYPAAPDLWEGSGELPPPGLYRVGVGGYALPVFRPASTDAGGGPDDAGEPLAECPLLIDPRAEVLRFGVDGAALARIAQAGGGDVILNENGFAPWDAVPLSGYARESTVHYWLIGAGVALFLLGLFFSAWRR